jgi:hypothetical protein
MQQVRVHKMCQMCSKSQLKLKLRPEAAKQGQTAGTERQEIHRAAEPPRSGTPQAGPPAEPSRLPTAIASTAAEGRRARADAEPTRASIEGMVGEINAIDLAGQPMRMRKRQVRARMEGHKPMQGVQ